MTDTTKAPRKLTACQIAKLDREIAEREAFIANPGRFASLVDQTQRELDELRACKAAGLPAPKPRSVIDELFGISAPRELLLAPVESSDVIVPVEAGFRTDLDEDQEEALIRMYKAMVID